jgi:hypothetical protein
MTVVFRNAAMPDAIPFASKCTLTKRFVEDSQVFNVPVDTNAMIIRVMNAIHPVEERTAVAFVAKILWGQCAGALRESPAPKGSNVLTL